MALTALIQLAVSSTVTAGSPPNGELAPVPAAIVGGAPTPVCAWPAVVALRTGGVCTATLVHPEVIVYAAHCGTLHSKALFGEDIDTPAREVPIRECARFAKFNAVSSMDYAYCVLEEAVTDVPLIPLLSGCEESLIGVGTPVTIVGFGNTNPDPDAGDSVGIKHAAETSITGILTTIGIGGMGTGADSGDSGGPALVQVADGSWRVLGIVSGGGGHGATVQYVPAPLTLPWIEGHSDIDISPCTDVDPEGDVPSSWAPTPTCGGFFVANDESPEASWAEGCAGPLSELSEACGDPWTPNPEAVPPSVAFVAPLADEHFPLAPAHIDVEAAVDPGDSGVRSLTLAVDGVPWTDGGDSTVEDAVPPYRFLGVEIEAPGEHVLTLQASDHEGRVGVASVTVVVAEIGGEESGSETGETGVGGEDEIGSRGDEGGAGCTCEFGSRSPGPGRAWGVWATMALLGAAGRRRRRGNESGSRE